MTKSKAADVLSITAVSFFSVYSFSMFRDIYLSDVIGKYIFSNIIVNLILSIITLVFVVSVDYYYSTKLFCCTRGKNRKTIITGFGLIVIISVCECISGTIVLRNYKYITIANSILTYLAVAMLEEEFFRKILFEELLKKISIIGAVALSTLAFVFPHIIMGMINKTFGIFNMISLLFFGIILLEIYIRFGLLCAISLHTIWDVIAEGKFISNHKYIFYYSLFIATLAAVDIIRNAKNLTIASTMTTRPDTQSASLDP